MKLTRRRKYRGEARGLLPFEAQAFIHIPLYVPYYQDFLKERYKLFNQAAKEGWSTTKYIQAIKLLYEARGWWIPSTRIDKASAFKALRDYEKQWRQSTDPNDPYLLRQRRKHHGGNELLNRDKVLQEKTRYRQTHKEQIAEYRRTHRTQINEARRKREQFKRSQGL